MTPELLEHFLVVVKYLNISHAADALYLSNSSLGRQMSRLESWFGAPLFVRTSRSITLTPAGRALADAAPALLENIREVRNKVSRASGSDVPELTVAMINVSNHSLIGSFKDFRRLHPEVSVSFIPREPGSVIKYVEQNIADIGVESSSLLSGAEDGLEIITVDNLEYCVLVPPSHRLADKGSVRLEELTDEQFIALEGAPPENFLRAFNEQRDLLKRLLDSHIAVPTWQDMMLQVEMGSGIALLPKAMTYNYVTGCVRLDLETGAELPSLVMFWKSENNKKYLRSFTDYVRKRLCEQAAEIPSE